MNLSAFVLRGASLRQFITCAVISFLIVFMTSCAAPTKSENISTATSAIPATTGIVVVGVVGDITAAFRSGALFEDGSFEHEGGKASEFTSEQGKPYLVHALAPTANNMRYAMFRASLAGKDYEFECGQILPVLTVAADQVQYYGDFQVVIEDGKLKVKQSFDIEKAQAYIDNNYPNSQWVLKPGALDRARSTQCLQVPPAAIVG